MSGISTRRAMGLASALLLACLATSVFAQPKAVTAKIRKVDTVGRVLEVEISGEGFGRQFVVAEDATITINNQRASLSDLKPDMTATVTADLRAELIKRISARVQAKPIEEETDPEPSDEEPKDRPERRSKGNAAAKAALVVTGGCPPELEDVDDVIKDFLAGRKIRGAAAAIVKDGKCVLARGYGFADEEETQNTLPETPFPVVGVSRVLTAVAVLKFAEEGKIDLDETFVDSAQLPVQSIDEKIRKVNPFFRLTTMNMLKMNSSMKDDDFKVFFRNPTLKPGADALMQALPDREGFQHLDSDPFGAMDTQYLLLGRMVARAGGGRYEPYVKRAILDPLGAKEAKVRIARADVEEGKKKKKKKESLPFDGVAQLENQFEEPSMRIDSSGGWLCSAMDLARFAKAFDDPDNSPLLKAESIETMLAKGRKEAAKKTKPVIAKEGDGEGKRKLGEAYFSCGWQVYSVKSKDDVPLTSIRRYVHSGPASLTSDRGIHVVLLFTRATPTEKSASEHPLMKELKEVIEEIGDEWPDVDYFKTPPGSEPVPSKEPSVAAAPTNPGGVPMPMGPPSLPTLPNLKSGMKDRILATFQQIVAIGQRLEQSEAPLVLTTGLVSGDLKAAAEKSPGAQSAIETAFKEITEILTSTLFLRAEAEKIGGKDFQAAEALYNFLDAKARAYKGLSELVTLSFDVSNREKKMADYLGNEQTAARNLIIFLRTFMAAYPREATAATTDADFLEAIVLPQHFVQASLGERMAAIAARIGPISTIQVKGAGAAPADQARLRQLIGEIQAVGAQLIKDLQEIKTSVDAFLQAETAAGSKYVDAWQAMSDLVTAELTACDYLSKYGTAEAESQDQQKINSDVSKNLQRLLETLKALQAGPAPADAAANENPASPDSP